jgi:hypothetical protein
MTSTTILTENLRRPRAVWWAVLVAVLFALVPTLTRALAFAGLDGAERIEICTTQGPKAVAAESTHAVDSATGQDSTTTQTHCPFCLHQADRFAPPPHLLPSLFAVQDGQQEISGWQVFFYFDKNSLWAPPRGPPLVVGT